MLRTCWMSDEEWKKEDKNESKNCRHNVVGAIFFSSSSSSSSLARYITWGAQSQNPSPSTAAAIVSVQRLRKHDECTKVSNYIHAYTHWMIVCYLIYAWTRKAYVYTVQVIFHIFLLHPNLNTSRPMQFYISMCSMRDVCATASRRLWSLAMRHFQCVSHCHTHHALIRRIHTHASARKRNLKSEQWQPHWCAFCFVELVLIRFRFRFRASECFCLCLVFSVIVLGWCSFA